MRNLVPDNMEIDILQTLWLQRLPSNLQQILSVCKASFDELAQIAVKIHEVSVCNLIVARVKSKPECVELDAIRAELANLKTWKENCLFLDIYTVDLNPESDR
ncbi:hypothetical protein AVEN_70120-1 [Araneus ventricosus]|uniref:Uncharacterized protein n=1 Tax=Araneus ventricosus TaxID=182803 RepID=A0A4Y2EK41_ARAVE|nr:hypothetical protein AVEN_70120-1 [Araneus ventricosus]